MTDTTSVTTYRPGEDDSDWEYEYDEKETENFFVTLDLTTHATPSSLARLREVPVIKGPRLATPAIAPASSLTQDGSKKGMSLPPHTQPTKDDLQFLDLQTANPVLAYKGQTYSCTWATRLGTDIFASDKISGTANTSEAKVVGASSLHLVAKPVDLVRKEDKAQKEVSSPRNLATPQSGTLGSSNLNDDALSTGEPSFLDRLTSLKAMKGDPDRPMQIQFYQYRVPERQKVATGIKRKRSSNAKMGPPPVPTAASKIIQSNSATPVRQSTAPPRVVDGRGSRLMSLPTEQRPHRGPGSRGGRVRGINNFHGAASRRYSTLPPEKSAIIHNDGTRSQSVETTGALTSPSAPNEQHTLGPSTPLQQKEDSNRHRAFTVESSSDTVPHVGQPPDGLGKTPC